MRLRSPLKRRGAHHEKWHRWQEHNRTLVLVRSGWKCEVCGSNMRPLEWAHLATRGNVISEPWCSLAELTAALCSSRFTLGCHEKIDRNLEPELLRDLRQTALIRLMGSFAELRMLNYGNPLDGIREAVRQLEAAGYAFDHEAQSIERWAPVITLPGAP